MFYLSRYEFFYTDKLLMKSEILAYKFKLDQILSH
jgi:hypothetical protein